MIFVILALAALGTLIGLFLYARWNYGVLESLGLTVVKPLHVLLGNTADFHTKVSHLEDYENFKKYGPVYGVYYGREPTVHVCDAELMKHIMVTDYEYFRDRRIFDYGSPLMNEFPDNQPYEKWKLLRHLLSPTFTLAKIKRMTPAMQDSLVDFTTKLKKDITENKSAGEKVDVKSEIFTMLTDMITRCVFSIKIDSEGSCENQFVKIVKRFMGGEEGGDDSPSFLKSLAFSFPIIRRLLPNYFDVKASDDFVRIFKTILDARKKSGEKHGDFVDQIKTWMEKLDTAEFKDNNISELTILCQALVFFIAGQDQIGTIAAGAICNASKNKNIEDKIIDEIDTFLEEHNGKIQYDNLSELKYLPACLDEAVRLGPYFTRVERICMQDWEKDGIKIKKGLPVVFPIWAINRNPEHFPDPEVFDPERFMPENKHNIHPFAVASFGHGPKNCIGKKFALDIMLMTLVHIYKNFRFKLREDTEFVYYPGIEDMAVHGPIYMDIELRDN